MGRIRVVIGDASPIFAAGLAAMLEESGRVEVVASATRLAELEHAVVEHQPDVVVSAFDPPVEWRDVVSRSHGRPVLVMGWSNSPDDVLHAIRSRANGFVAKSEPGQSVVDAVLAIVAGRSVYPNGWQESVLDIVPRRSSRDPDVTQLTPRERDIVELIVEGASNKEIARTLGLAQQTIKNQLGHLMIKVGVTSRLQLYRWAAEKGIPSRSSRTIDLRGAEEPNGTRR